MQLPSPDILSEHIKNNPKFFPFFKDALGAIDGTHIPCFPPAAERARYRDKDGNITQNVLAACTFEMHFCYILSGWEGSIADSFLFDKARAAGLHIPDGKYYLADAGFACCDSLLVPYRGTHYHLREWGLSDAQ